MTRNERSQAWWKTIKAYDGTRFWNMVWQKENWNVRSFEKSQYEYKWPNGFDIIGWNRNIVDFYWKESVCFITCLHPDSRNMGRNMLSNCPNVHFWSGLEVRTPPYTFSGPKIGPREVTSSSTSVTFSCKNNNFPFNMNLLAVYFTWTWVYRVTWLQINCNTRFHMYTFE